VEYEKIGRAAKRLQNSIKPSDENNITRTPTPALPVYSGGSKTAFVIDIFRADTKNAKVNAERLN
jgi:hypothetical protein